MYVVIFKATIAQTDEVYSRMAEQLRELAFSRYGCLKFTAVTEGDEEIALSYWPSLQHISDWKNDPLHTKAQNMGREKWYRSFSVEICELLS